MNLSGFSSRLPGGRKGLRVIGVTIKLGILEHIEGRGKVPGQK